MWALAAAVALTYGLLRAAAAEPRRRLLASKRKLAQISAKDPARLSLDESEDGLALSRRLGKKDLETKFADKVSVLKQQRRSN
jgi:hypothetical protein